MRLTKKQRVEKGLKQCLMDYHIDEYNEQCMDCPYFDPDIECMKCKQYLLEEALEVLKPRMMTLEEVNGMEWDYCYVEEEMINDNVLRIFCGKYRVHCITWPSIAHYKTMFGGESAYGKRWRCWTQKPTDKQRKAEKWDDYDNV